MELTTTQHDLVITDGQGRPATTSRIVADRFGKQHKNVLRDIESLDCSAEFRRLNFEPSLYQNTQGKMQPMQFLTKDGCTFLIMGFTGEKAARWKEAYIAEFNRMETELGRRAGHAAIPAADTTVLFNLSRRSRSTEKKVDTLIRKIDRMSRTTSRYADLNSFLRCCTMDTGLRIAKQSLYAAYTATCEAINCEPCAYNTFFQRLYQVSPLVKPCTHNKRPAVSGIALKKEVS